MSLRDWIRDHPDMERWMIPEKVRKTLSCSPTPLFDLDDIPFSISDLPFNTRARNTIDRLGILTVLQLIQVHPDNLRAGPGVGPRTYREIVQTLSMFGLCLGVDIDLWKKSKSANPTKAGK